MRPLRLEVEGFTCYRDRQPPLEFSELSLFAIAGPDRRRQVQHPGHDAVRARTARCRASASRAYREFISHGRDRMSVALDFRVRGRDYSVTRAVEAVRSRGLKTEATLAELTGGVETQHRRARSSR